LNHADTRDGNECKPGKTNRTRTQVLPRTKPNPTPWRTTEQIPNPNVMVLTRFFHRMKLQVHSHISQ